MTSGQEGIVITKIQIYTELLQKFGVSETKFCSFPPVLQSSDQVPSFIIPQNKPKSVLVHPLKGHQDWTTLSRVKGGLKIATNPETPYRLPGCLFMGRNALAGFYVVITHCFV